VKDIGETAQTHERNAYKVELLRRTVVRALIQAQASKETA